MQYYKMSNPPDANLLPARGRGSVATRALIAGDRISECSAGRNQGVYRQESESVQAGMKDKREQAALLSGIKELPVAFHCTD